ncbi:30S ribosomal protein S13 [Candidatus Babeliales bacterium]|nr:30S ribosomal protein S13 [Candidatus Babeliales bacterium]
MARISGVFLPKEKRVEYGLTYIYGIGLKTSKDILKEVKVSPDTRVKDLTGAEIASIQKLISQDYLIGGDLKKEITMNIKRLADIGAYRGSRHRKSLPVRGQRTKTNARTRKGPKKVSGIVAKKKAPGKK